MSHTEWVKYDVLPTPHDLATRAAELVAGEIRSSTELVLGLAGGSTPKLTYEVLSDMELAWDGVTAWMTDERWVEPDHPDSNQAMVRATLGTEGKIAFLAPDTNLEEPAESALRMTKSMEWLTERPDARSLTLLGMGDDGHTASLFPGTEALAIAGDAYLSNWVPHLDTWRLTASFGLLAHADVVLFLVAGANKAEIISQIASGGEYPAARVTAKDHVLWLLDEAAASKL